MKTTAPSDQRPPELQFPQKPKEFPPVHPNLLHDRLIECFDGKIPVVYGGWRFLCVHVYRHCFLAATAKPCCCERPGELSVSVVFRRITHGSIGD